MFYIFLLFTLILSNSTLPMYMTMNPRNRPWNPPKQDNPLLIIKRMYANGDKKALATKKRDLENTLNYISHDQETIKIHLASINKALNALFIDILHTIAHADLDSAKEAFLTIKNVWESQLQEAYDLNTILNWQNYIHNVGFNELKAAYFLLEDRPDYQEELIQKKLKNIKKIYQKITPFDNSDSDDYTLLDIPTDVYTFYIFPFLTDSVVAKSPPRARTVETTEELNNSMRWHINIIRDLINLNMVCKRLYILTAYPIAYSLAQLHINVNALGGRYKLLQDVRSQKNITDLGYDLIELCVKLGANANITPDPFYNASEKPITKVPKQAHYLLMKGDKVGLQKVINQYRPSANEYDYNYHWRKIKKIRNLMKSPLIEAFAIVNGPVSPTGLRPEKKKTPEPTKSESAPAPTSNQNNINNTAINNPTTVPTKLSDEEIIKDSEALEIRPDQEDQSYSEETSEHEVDATNIPLQVLNNISQLTIINSDAKITEDIEVLEIISDQEDQSYTEETSEREVDITSIPTLIPNDTPSQIIINNNTYKNILLNSNTQFDPLLTPAAIQARKNNIRNFLIGIGIVGACYCLYKYLYQEKNDDEEEYDTLDNYELNFKENI